MAMRTASAPINAGNNPGSSPAVVFDWHFGVADFHHGTGIQFPTSVAEYTTASDSFHYHLNRFILYLRRESIYACWAARSKFRPLLQIC